MLTVLEAASTKQLISLEALKCILGISDAGDDILLETLLNAASEFIVEYTGREFARERVLETIPGYGTTQLLLSRAYVDTITSITHTGDIITDYIIEDPKAGILYRAGTWDWTAGIGFTLTTRPLPGTEEPKFAVDYYGGYWLSSFDGAKPAAAVKLPASLELVCADLVQLWYNEKKSNITPGTESIRVGDYSVKNATNKGIPDSILFKLEKWVRLE